jgi:hypothetical protein
MPARRIDYKEAQVRVHALSNLRVIRELTRDGDLKHYEAAVMAKDGRKADELRQKLHDNLDEMLDGITEMISLIGLVNPPPD